MEYLEVEESIIPYLLEQVMDGVRDSMMKELSKQYGFEICKDHSEQIIHSYYFDPQSDFNYVEDVEVQNKVYENYQAYRILQSKAIYKRQDSVKYSNQASQHYTKTRFNQSKLIWDRFNSEAIALEFKEIEDNGPTDEDKLRIMKLEQQAEQKRQQQKQAIRALEQKRLKDLHQKIEQNLKKNEYTYDYDCQPLIRKNIPIKQELLINHSYRIPTSKNTKQRSQIMQIEQIKQEQESMEINGEVEEDRQKSNIPFMLVSEGVTLRENNKTIQNTHQQNIKQLKKNEYQKLDPNFIISLYNNNQTIISKEDIVKNTVQEKKEKPIQSFELVNQEIIKQKLMRLPKIKRNDLNSSTSQATQITPKSYGRTKSSSVHTPKIQRDQVKIHFDISQL